MNIKKWKRLKKNHSLITVFAAIAGNILVAIVKFIAAWISGSSAMLSEGIHSLVDTGDGLLVLYGMKAAKKKPDIDHPFGYGKKLYFFTFIVAILIFALGGCLSIYKGINSWIFANSIVLKDLMLNYVVLIISMIIEGSSLFVAIKNFNNERGKESVVGFIRETKNPSNFIIAFEDSAAELGLVIAFFGISLSQITGIIYFDAAASILIGLILISVSIILFYETEGLLIGEGLNADQIKQVVEIVEENKNVRVCGQVRSLYMGPDNMILTLDVNFDQRTTANAILRSIDDIEAEIKRKLPEAKHIFIEVESLKVTQKQKTDQEKLIQEEEQENQ